jgi:hypothetical protein
MKSRTKFTARSRLMKFPTRSKLIQMKNVFIFVLTLLSLHLHAQTETVMSRKGIVFGLASGVAQTRIKFPTKVQNSTDLALNWKFGYAINPRLVLLLNGSVSVYTFDLSDRKRKRDFGGLFPSAQYFVSDRFWVMGGMGLCTEAPVFYDLDTEIEAETKYYTGFGAITSVGYELIRIKNCAVDLQARLNFGNADLDIGIANGRSAALLLGVHFY